MKDKVLFEKDETIQKLLREKDSLLASHHATHNNPGNDQFAQFRNELEVVKSNLIAAGQVAN